VTASVHDGVVVVTMFANCPASCDAWFAMTLVEAPEAPDNMRIHLPKPRQRLSFNTGCSARLCR